MKSLLHASPAIFGLAFVALLVLAMLFDSEPLLLPALICGMAFLGSGMIVNNSLKKRKI